MQIYLLYDGIFELLIVRKLLYRKWQHLNDVLNNSAGQTRSALLRKLSYEPTHVYMYAKRKNG